MRKVRLILLTFFFFCLFADPLIAKASESVIISIEKFTIGQGYIVQPTIVSFSKGDTAAKAIDYVLKENGITYTHRGTFTDTFYLEKINNSDNGKYIVPSCIKNMGTFVTSDNSSILPPTGNEINEAFPDLTEHSYMSTSGWMYTVAGKDVSQISLSDYYLEDGDVLRFQFTLYGYGADLGLIYDNEDFPLKLPDRNEITKRLALINQNKAKILMDEGYRNAYDVAMNTITSLNSSKKSMEDALASLPSETEIESYLSSYDEKAVQIVKDNIDSIGEVLDISQETIIISTRHAFYDLSEAQQAEVGTDRKTKLDNAVVALQAIIDQNVADELATLIIAFGPVTLEKESDLLIIENMYENLTEGARACLTDATKEALTTIKNELEALKIQHEADIKAANSVANKIYAIGTVTLTKATRIRNIRKDYDALSAGAKAIIPDSIYKILTEAEEELAVLEAKDAKEKAAKKEAEDKKSADDVITKINALGTITIDKASAISSARKAYDALNADAKKLVSSTVLEKLTVAEKKIVSLKNEQVLKKKYTPSKVVIKAPKLGKKTVKVTWKKVRNATGYQVFMAKKKASGYKKIATIKKAKTVTFTKKKLKSKKTYYFRVRAYKIVGKKTYYGEYSATKKAKVK